MTRSYGNGSRFQRADGQWVAQLDFGRRPDGSRDRRTRYAASKTAADRALRDLRKLRRAEWESNEETD